jgi:hypothetical protein
MTLRVTSNKGANVQVKHLSNDKSVRKILKIAFEDVAFLMMVNN